MEYNINKIKQFLLENNHIVFNKKTLFFLDDNYNIWIKFENKEDLSRYYRILINEFKLINPTITYLASEEFIGHQDEGIWYGGIYGEFNRELDYMIEKKWTIISSSLLKGPDVLNTIEKIEKLIEKIETHDI